MASAQFAAPLPLLQAARALHVQWRQCAPGKRHLPGCPPACLLTRKTPCPTIRTEPFLCLRKEYLAAARRTNLRVRLRLGCIDFKPVLVCVRAVQTRVKANGNPPRLFIPARHVDRHIAQISRIGASQLRCNARSVLLEPLVSAQL